MKKLFYFYSFMNTNMNTLVCNTVYCKVLQIETRTENPCVGGSIPPLGTNLLICNPISKNLGIYNLFYINL